MPTPAQQVTLSRFDIVLLLISPAAVLGATTLTAVSYLSDYPFIYGCVLGLPIVFMHFVPVIALVIAVMRGMIFVVTLHPVQHTFKKAILPAAISLAAFTVSLFIPTSQIMIDFMWNANQEAFHVVVQMVEDEEISPYRHYLTELPEEYQYLSKDGGEILVETDGQEAQVFFFTVRGVLDSFSGYFYQSGILPPQVGDLGGDWQHIRQLAPHWFYCVSY